MSYRLAPNADLDLDDIYSFGIVGFGSGYSGCLSGWPDQVLQFSPGKFQSSKASPKKYDHQFAHIRTGHT